MAGEVTRNVNSHKRIALAGIGALLLAMTLAAGTPSAAEAPPKLWTVGQNCGDPNKMNNGECGGGAGETVIPRGIAADPVSGHIYVADQVNRRISEFTAWGVFAKAWGWGVRDGSPELQTCGPEATVPSATCQEGISGTGAGQLSTPQGVALDSSGDLYVVDHNNFRVQKFDSEGNFLLMFGGEVNETSGGNLCPRPGFPADVCKTGTTGTAAGQFSANWPFSSYIAVGPADQVYVGDENRIQRFDTAGAYQGEIALPEPGVVASLAVDPGSGAIYFAYPTPERSGDISPQPNVHKLDPLSGKEIGTLEVERPSALAVAGDGTLYVAEQESMVGDNNDDPRRHEARIIEFDSSGAQVGLFAEGEFGEHPTSKTTGIAANTVTEASGIDVYLSNPVQFNSFISAYGPPPDKWLPPAVAPSIVEEYAISVDPAGATLGAQINAHFWSDVTYYVQYGEQPCSEGGCAEYPAPPGAKLGTRITDEPVASAGVFLDGLEPGRTYHYRFVAQSGGGGPVFGEDHTFTTPELPANETSCPNQVYRSGPAAILPDCRAYELVSPIDKAGGDVGAVGGDSRFQSSSSGESITYSSYRPFCGAMSSPTASQYLASRGGGGWSCEAISPPQQGEQFVAIAQLSSLFNTFSPDLTTAWTLGNTEPVLGPGGVPGVANLYRRENTGSSYQACTTAAAEAQESNPVAPELVGVAADQQHAVFMAASKLTPDAAEVKIDGQYQLYECSFGGGEAATVRLVSVLPDGTPSPLRNTAGTAADAYLGSLRSLGSSWLDDAISDDGSRVFWTATTGQGGPGALYARVNAGEDQSPVGGSGKCTKAFKACTYPLMSGAVARYWGADPAGSKALFAVQAGPLGGDLYFFDVERAIKGEEPKTLVAKKTRGVLGASEDLSRIYFLSEEQIGGEGVSGKPNLYLYEAGEAPSTTFIGTLSADDAIERELPTPVSVRPEFHTAQVNAAGTRLGFTSNSSELAEAVAGYDNTDLASDEPTSQVYFYTDAGELVCVSCNPSGARPGSARRVKTGKDFFRWEAARFNPWLTALHTGHALSEDRQRIFFESFEPLLPQDTNGKADVYQWEEAGVGSCDVADPTYADSSGGCLGLISSGKSEADTRFVDASADGEDVFITTAASLLSYDPGLVDLYDARVEGGFPPPAGPKPGCEGEACQSPSRAPDDPTPASATFKGAGNPVKRGAKARRCAKGRRKVKSNKGKTRCVKRKRASANRRAGR